MRLELSRDQITDSFTLGLLKVDGSFKYYTLERTSVAIPTGEYSIEMTFSPRFGRPLPLLDNVPGRTAIRIHPANKAEELEGCIAPGLQRTSDGVAQSRTASDELNIQIQAALDAGDSVTIEISEP